MTNISFCFLLLVIAIAQAAKEIVVEVQLSNGTIIYQDIIEYIEEGKIKMSTSCNATMEEHAIMVLGMTGTGKTTLINYLNDVPLVCYRDPETRKWLLDLAPDAISLPCGFTIGHGTKSETIYPSVYTPPGTDYSYVDNPGFQDTRGIAMEIANNFFRSYATEKANDFKFVLLITYPDLQVRGQQFRETIKRFSETLGIFSESDVKNLAKSVAIIVTRVENDGDTDEEMRTFLSLQLLQILNEEENAGRLTVNERKVFSQILKTKQVEIFSNPKIFGPVNDIQSKQIRFLIDSMIYFNKMDAKFRLAISPNYIPTLFEYIEDRYNSFKYHVEAILQQNLSYFIKKELDKAIIVEKVRLIESVLRDVVLKGSQKVNFETFINNMNINILDNESKEALNNKMKVLEFFVQLLPIEMQERYSGDKNYLNEFHLESTINSQINFLIKMYKVETMIESGTLVIKACFIKSSDIVREIEKSAKVKAVAVHACQAVYFDMNLELQDYHNMTIIAPKWNVDEKIVNIDLSGSNALNYPKAESALIPGAHGKDGVPGRCGKNGGIFYGFGYRFSNIENLVFSLSGGHGGNGQEGGNGAASLDGSMCDIPSPGYVCQPPCPSISGVRDVVIRPFYNFGTYPANGGNGGSGGLAGFGGLAGSAKIVKLEDKLADKFETQAHKTGYAGLNGKDGNGGTGAIGGCYYRCERLHYYYGWRCCKSTCLGTCCDYHTCDTQYWMGSNRLEEINTCISRTNGVTPVSKNSIGLELNEIPPADDTKSHLINYKIEQHLNGYSELYPSFLNGLDNYVL